MVTEKQYYEDTIANMKDLFAYQNTVSQRICDLEQRVAIDETSIAKNFELMEVQNSWQNKFFDEKFRYADLLEQCRINEATCKCIKGEVYASPSNLADPYVGRQMVIGSYALPICGEYNAYNTGYGCGYNAYNGYNYGCGCGL